MNKNFTHIASAMQMVHSTIINIHMWCRFIDTSGVDRMCEGDMEV